MYKQFWQNFPHLLAVTTTRRGGISQAPFATNNLALHVGDNEDDVHLNRKTTLDHLKIKANEIVFTHQFHSDVLVKVTKNDGGKGVDHFAQGIKADALYTVDKNLALAVYHADCVPLFLYVPSKPLIAIIHAGEEGSVSHISAKVVAYIMQEENIKPTDIFALIGPSLSFSHRLISEKHAFALMQKDDIIQKAVKATLPHYFLDLPLLNFLDLRSMGIPVENITLSNECTYEDNETYFSYAKEKTTGRNISIIKLI